MKLLLKQKSVLPGFGPALGFTLFYLTIIVLIPISMLFLKTATLGWSSFWETVSSPRVIASFGLSFGTSFTAALINVIFGLIVAWVLVRYRFPGKKIIDMLIDLPFALPTAVAGIALTTAFSERGLLGSLLGSIGIKTAFTPLGIIIALTFIGLPFVVRAVQPVLEDLDKEMEEAAVCLGARRWQTFVHVILPILFPALMSGFAMAFARALGEYGSVVFIAGNIPMKSEITPLLIITKLEQYDYAGATAIATVMLIASFACLFIINRLQWWSHHRQEA
ncbi:MAG: sulfate ABC transporter permease subunit CysT [Deltaproteobacteria bacterium]|nr:sulfate ABC transporter permease subunit CysT [Deltaproteobacteria bacterium]